MSNIFTNPTVVERFDELITDGEAFLKLARSKKQQSGEEAVAFTRWATSCLNLLDKLSSSTNRFVKEFEYYCRFDRREYVNVAMPLGVLKSARDEYVRGLAIDYHLSVSAAVYGGILEEASYLLSRGYLRAASVLIGAALEEGLKSRARAIPIEVGPRETLQPLIIKLKAPDVALITEFDARQLEAIARLRNDAAHGHGEFNYQNGQVSRALDDVRHILMRLLGGG